MTDAAHMKQAVENYMKAVSTVDLDMIREIYADNATVEDPVGTPPHEGIEAIVTFYGAMKGMGVQLQLTGNVRCTGNAAAFPFQAKVGPITMEIIDVFEFNDQGKVVSMRAYWGPENRF
ncbi:nuclear transport factor 2 family protein [Ketobacter sp.]|uniref:nuclear transport factor 2 family protein n=1 Tax=Ketobacter sp. TaxID=2083498 RepID=UPI0025C3D17D